MSNPYPDLDNFLEKYNSILELAQSKAIFVRGIEQQKEQVSILADFISEIKKEKNKAKEINDNRKANFLLCLQLSASSVMHELLCLINLKEDNSSIAWDFLINAQNAICLAIRNHPFNGDYLNGYAHKLYAYEKTFFPEMYFASRGCIVSKSKCSICKEYIENCDHIIGYSYMGEICFQIIEEIISIDEISLVKNPADKTCRIISFDEKGKKYDAFTHREIIE